MEEPVADKMVTTVCAHCGNVIDVTGLEPGDGITCPYCTKEFSITRQFGNFLLSRHLGSGGMGTVYLGHDMTLKREVAVKVLKPELVADQKFMATFLREAEITASLNHPNIVQVYAFGKHEEVYYLVVEYISGGSLDDKIVNRGKITELEGIEIGIAVARGLECALQRGLIHRDIKPGNILFNANNTPKVVDFGLSLSFETADHFDGEIWGTPYYVAPEKLERRPEDFRSDLYSLGATLFHAISGRPPYEGEDPNDVAMKHLNGNVVSLKAFVPNISDQTTYAVSKAMARHPEDRYETYAEFISQLEDAKRRITDPNFKERQQEKVVILETTESAKNKEIMIIGVVVIIIILLGTIFWKGSSLFEQKKSNAPALNMNDYAPDGESRPVVTPPAPRETETQPQSSESPVSTPVPPPPSASQSVAPETTAVTGGTRLEAEAGTKLGDAKVYDDSGASGGKIVYNLQDNGSGIMFSDVPAATSLTLVYAAPSSGTISLYVNGVKIRGLDFTSNQVWGGSFVSKTFSVNIPAGATIKLEHNDGDTAVNIDCIILKSQPSEPPASAPVPPLPSANQSVAPETTAVTGGTRFEAEAATKMLTANVMDDSAASGGKLVGNLSVEGSGIVFDNVPAATSLTIRYASFEAGAFSLYVNGTKVAKLEFTANGAWTGSYVFKTFNVNIPAGATLKLQHDEGDTSLNIDYIILK